MKENKKDTNKKPVSKTERDTSKDLPIMVAMILSEIERTNRYLKFLAECEAMKHGVELHDS